MTKTSLFALILVALCANIALAANDKTLEGDGVSAQILGQSGKIRVTPGGDTAGEFTADWGNLREVDADGASVGGSSHDYNSVASTDFEFGAIEPVEYQGIGAQQVSFWVTDLVDYDTSLTVDVILFNETGTVTNDDEELSVERGSTKFSIAIDNWPFCTTDTCSGDVGEYLELSIDIKGKDSKAENNTEGVFTYANAVFVTSRKVLIDGVWADLPDGYPQLHTSGNKDTYTFRFPKFTSSLSYDPIVSFNSAAAAVPSFITLFMIGIVLLAAQ
jgi:hypothetical protein